MDTISFDKLLLKTAFCCMAADGHIDDREIRLLKSICESTPLFKEFNFESEINRLVMKMNDQGKDFLLHYYQILENLTLSEEEELALIDFAIRILKADEQIEYTEVKFFKTIRYRLKVSDNRILQLFPDIEQFIEEDIMTNAHVNFITNQYLNAIQLPQFAVIKS